MGCGGSKEDVATGNTVTRRSILQRASSITKRKPTSSDVDDATSKTKLVNDQANGAVVEKAPVTDGKANLASANDSSDEYYSSRREMESLEAAVAASEGTAEYFSPLEDVADANMVGGGDHEEKTKSEGVREVEIIEAKKDVIAASPETKEEKEKVENGDKEDDGESLGNLSVDFKEAISIIEEAEAEVANSEKKEEGESKINVSQSSAH
ncbi:hypothetical protein Cni_G15467 [Canna indica]|uniref:Uncharacterized protein n=1 Tax=Canna indica TaxID=4628 RepID=A0AAQ3QEX0_9LILI|nr:hypothetical protein Cni_G15467 [Canna indica]